MNKSPKGLCRLGDRARYNEKEWRVAKLGLKNEHGYPLDLRLKADDGETRKVSAHDGDLVIYPPDGEIPDRLAAYAKEEGLEVIREPSNGDAFVYQLRCRKCGDRPWLTLTTFEGACLRYADGRFYNTRPDITDSEVELHCQCAAGNHPLPDGFEVNWG